MLCCSSARFDSNDTRYAYVGETVNLSCEFGEPYKPLLTTWNHNGTVINPQKNSSTQRRYSSNFDINDSKAWLEIQDVQYSDAGLYTCLLIHSDKRSEASWTLRVLLGEYANIHEPSKLKGSILFYHPLHTPHHGACQLHL